MQSSTDNPSPINPVHKNRVMTRLRFVSLATVITIYILILVGGIVRATGSGMGCPDWPTCFGRWIPPTSEAQLPADYQTIYAERGYADTTFNLKKTWTEYLNRLLGVFTGLWIIATMICALPFRRTDTQLVYAAVAGVLLVVFQGWLGSRVVASNLAPGMITLHMLLAQVIVCILIYTFLRANRHSLIAASKQSLSVLANRLLLAALVLTLLQMLLGTQVREAIDIIARAHENDNRHLWIMSLPTVFPLHRILAYPTVIVNLALVILVFRERGLPQSARVVAGGIMVLTAGTMVMGLSLDRLHVPAFAQPLHLWLASMILGGLFYLYVVNRYASQSAATRGGENRSEEEVATGAADMAGSH